MQTRDEVKGLHNRREFSQHLECLYQAMQTQEKRFLLLLQNNFPAKKKRKTLCMALIKGEILTSRKILYTKSCTRYQLLFCKKILCKIRFFDALNVSLSEEKLTDLLCNDFPCFSRRRNG